MKLGLVYTLFGRKAGAELFAEKIISGLSAYPELEIIVYANSEAGQSLSGLKSPSVSVKLIPALNNQFTKLFWLEWQAKYIVLKDDIDVFWIPSGCNSFPGKWNVPSVVTFLDFGEYHVPEKYDFKRMFYRKRICIPRAINRGSIFTTISHTTSNDLAGLFKKQSHTIYPGCSPRSLTERQGNALETVLLETGMNIDFDFIFTPGRTDYIGKGLDVLIAAFDMLTKHIDNSPHLILIGPQGEGHHKLINDIRRRGLDKHVHLFGRVSDECVDALYSACSFVVFASRYEGFGFPLLEAMQAEVPIISSNGGSLSEVSGNGALIFDSGDVAALFSSMQSLYQNKELQQLLIAEGLERIKHFQWDKCIEHMYQVFKAAAGLKGGC